MQARCALVGRGTKVIALVFLPLLGCSGGADGDPLGESPVTISAGPSGSADYSSIGAAIMAVPTGSTIPVEPGAYPPRLSITKALTLLGAGAGSGPSGRGSGAARAARGSRPGARPGRTVR